MAKILVKSSNTSSDTPSTSQATTAELCINTKDRKLYAGTDTGSSSSPGSTSGQVSWIGAYIDNGNISTNSADRLATQQAIKTYADTKAPIASPTFTGHSTIPSIGATTMYVTNIYDGNSADNSSIVFGGTSDFIKFYTDGQTSGDLALTLDSSHNATFGGEINLSGTSDILLGTGSTSGKIRFGTESWGNNIGLVGYWTVHSTNSNEGFKFQDDDDTLLLTMQGGTNSGGNGVKSATFGGDVIVKGNYVNINAGGVNSAFATDSDCLHFIADSNANGGNENPFEFWHNSPTIDGGTKLAHIGNSGDLWIANDIQAVGSMTAGGITCTTLNTGQGANELYDMDQNVKQDSNVEFAEFTATATLTAETNINCDGNITAGSGDIIAAGDFDSGNGSGAAPSHTFTSDKDTGMYRIGADQLGFATGGSKRLLISNTEMQLTGDLLVKAGSGASDLTVHGPSGQHANLFLLCDNASNNADKFKIQAGTDGYLRFFYNTGSYVEGASLKSNGSFSFANSTSFPAGFSVTGGTAYVGGTSIRNASILNAGTINTARLGSGTANSGTVLRGDNTWGAVAGGSSAVYLSGYTDLRGNSSAKYLGLVGGSGSTSTTFGTQMANGCHWVAPATGNLDSVRMVMEASWGSSTSIKVYVNAILVRSVTQSLTQTGASNDYNVSLDADANAGDTITVKVDPSVSSPQAAAWTFKYIPD
tara:strand:+ start:13143 stop:15257 length:2115 start_codon:yes stop_codon:yes gene_type:complete